MAYLYEDLFDTGNLESYDNPTSEVVSEPSLTMEKLMEIVERVTEPRGPGRSAESDILKLPHFNPELPGCDAATWCAIVSVIMDRRPLKGAKLYVTISRALKGSAAQWLTQIPIYNFNWTEFCQYFLSYYDGWETPTSVIIRIYNIQALKRESTGAFGKRLHALLLAKFANLTTMELINAIVLYRLTLHDRDVERIVFTKDIKTREQFYKEMGAFYHTKKLVSSSDNPSEESEAEQTKRSHHRNKCHRCGIYGHYKSECQKTMRRKKRRRSCNKAR